MSHYLPATPELLTPERWDGIDINNPRDFYSERLPVFASPGESQKAAIALAGCLEDVMLGSCETSEVELSEGSFEPSEEDMPDGTVLLLDTESLSKYIFEEGHEPDWKEPEKTEESGLDSDFLDLWRRRQPAAAEDDFGEETAIFKEEGILYVRAVKWGVILTSGGQRMLTTWELADPRTTGGGIGIAPGEADMAIGREAKVLPLPINRTVAQPDLQTFHFGIRCIEKVTDIKLVRNQAVQC
jgi:hypothetical protein